MRNWKTPQIKKLITAIASLESERELSAFLRDVCTLSELTEMAKRLRAAELLEEGYPIRQISEMTGLSTTTVSRVSQWKRNGEGGYALVLSKNLGES